jgi:quinol monooxygenase YgiN
MLCVAAKLKTVEGKGDELEAKFRNLVAKVLNEPGTKVYTIHRKADSPNEFLIYEKYENGDAFKFHMSTDYFKEFSKSIAPLLDGRAEIGIYNEIT